MMSPIVSKRDCIYQTRHTKTQPFAFDDQVAAVFGDMIHRSVPGYQALIDLIVSLTHQNAQPNTAIYDLGCSLGTLTYAIRQTAQVHPLHLYAIDNSPAMIDKARVLLSSKTTKYPTHILYTDIRHLDYPRPASVVILNYCLQFLPLADRDQVAKQIYQALAPGGILILSEKIHSEDPKQQQWLTEQHRRFKCQNGYSELEIYQKRQALENVLNTESLEQHQHRLITAGFAQPQIFFQCLQFVSLCAQKPQG